MESVQQLAQWLGFDIYRVPSKYFVLCEWYKGLVKMFGDSESGHQEAMVWLNEQKETVQR